MDWNSTSVSKDEYFHLLTMLTIKNDVTTLLTLAPYIRDPYISLGMLPLLAQFCVSIRDYYDSQNVPVNLPSLSSFSFDDVRLKLKLFSDPYKKSIKQILMADGLHDESFRSKLRLGVLTKYLQDPGVEEININSYNFIEIIRPSRKHLPTSNIASARRNPSGKNF